MATVNVTTSPVQLDDGAAGRVLVENTSTEDVYVYCGGVGVGKVQPKQKRDFYPGAKALTAKTQSGSSSVTTTTFAPDTHGILPVQTGHAGQDLQTDGSDVSWQAGGSSVASPEPTHVFTYNGGDYTTRAFPVYWPGGDFQMPRTPAAEVIDDWDAMFSADLATDSDSFGLINVLSETSLYGGTWNDGATATPAAGRYWLYVSIPSTATMVAPVLPAGAELLADAATPGSSIASQTGNAGKVLSTDGTNTEWIDAPSGGDGGTLYNVGIYSNSSAGANVFGADGTITIRPASAPGVNCGQVTLTTVPLKVNAGAGNGIGPFATVADGFTDVTGVVAECQVAVSNAAGTQKLIIGKTNIAQADWAAPIMTGWSVYEQVGSDLAISADGYSIDSTAGGQFLASVTWKFIDVS